MFYEIIASSPLFIFFIGFHDWLNIATTMISSQAIGPLVALIMAAIGYLCAPFLFGVAVATTISKGAIDPSTTSPKIIIIGIVAVVL
ncbi:MAG: hypothetical protein E3J37_10485 [Anaerolineales bacterium]|nr:MAG: hypothetical protein E3J37_10485 [Anaerolineales bacterium]